RAGTVEVDVRLAGQGLDRLQFTDVALREAAAIGAGAFGDNQAEVLIHHQSSRMGMQNLRGHADGVDRLIQREARVGRGATGYSFSQSSIPSDKLVGVVRALMRYS